MPICRGECRSIRGKQMVLAIDLSQPARESRCEAFLLRKEVIQPQVPLRLPCYDFIPVTSYTLGPYPPCGLIQALRVRPASMM